MMSRQSGSKLGDLNTDTKEMAEPHPEPNADLRDDLLGPSYPSEFLDKSDTKTVIFSLPYPAKLALLNRILAPLSRAQIDDICTTGLQQGHTSAASQYLEWLFLAHAPTEAFKILYANEANIDLLLFLVLLPPPWVHHRPHTGSQNGKENQVDDESRNYPVLKSFPLIDEQGLKRQAIGIVSECWGTGGLKRTVYPLAFYDALKAQFGQIAIPGTVSGSDFDSEKSDSGCDCPFGSCDCCDSDCSSEHELEYRGRGRSRPSGMENENEDSYNGTDALWSGGSINTTEFDPAMASAWRFDLASHSSLLRELEAAAATNALLTSTIPTTTAPSSSTSLPILGTAAHTATVPRTISIRENNAYEHFQKTIGKIKYDDGLSLIVARNVISARMTELYKGEGLKETKVEGAATAREGGNSGRNSGMTAGSGSVAEARYDSYHGDLANSSQIW